MSEFRRRLLLMQIFPEWEKINISGGIATARYGEDYYYTWEQAKFRISELGGRRLPTKEELQQLINSGYSWNAFEGVLFDQNLSLTAAGRWNSGDGFSYRGVGGFYWSSKEYSGIPASYVLSFDGTTVIATQGNTKSYGLSVRCIMNDSPYLKREDYILAGGLKWDKEDLKGGTYIHKFENDYYYTWEQAIARAAELGDRRLPTKEEFEALIAAGHENAAAGYFGGVVVLPAAGYWDISNNKWDYIGVAGEYLGSPVSDSNYFGLFFYDESAGLAFGSSGGGDSIRCIIDTTVEPIKYVEINGVKWHLKNLEGGTAEKVEDGNYYYNHAQALIRAYEVPNSRLPTEAEAQSLIDSGYNWSTVDKVNSGIFGEWLQLHANGYWDGRLVGKNIEGNYWSSTLNNVVDLVSFLTCYEGRSRVLESVLYVGFSARCVYDENIVKPYIEIDGIKWMKENLSGGDSTIDNGNHYYTWKQAKRQTSILGGQRMPTKAELQSLVDSGFVFTEATLPDYRYGTFGGKLELTAAGYRNSNGSFSYVGMSGFYWSSEEFNSDHGHSLYFTSGDAYMYLYAKSLGLSVRNIWDPTIPPQPSQFFNIVFNGNWTPTAKFNEVFELVDDSGNVVTTATIDITKYRFKIGKNNYNGITSLYGMFQDCVTLVSITLPDWNEVVNTSHMFAGCSSLTLIGLAIDWGVITVNDDMLLGTGFTSEATGTEDPTGYVTSPEAGVFPSQAWKLGIGLDDLVEVETSPTEKLLFYAPLTIDKVPTYSKNNNLVVLRSGSSKIVNNEFFLDNGSIANALIWDDGFAINKDFTCCFFSTLANASYWGYSAGLINLGYGRQTCITMGGWTGHLSNIALITEYFINVIPNTSINSNTKHFFTFSLDVAKNLKVYLDGLLVFSGKHNAFNGVAGTNFGIGQTNANNNRKGYYSHYAIYDMLTDEEVMNTYNHYNSL